MGWSSGAGHRFPPCHRFVKRPKETAQHALQVTDEKLRNSFAAACVTMRRMRRIPFFIFVFLILSSSAHAQVFGTVRVNLRDAQDLAVPGASVVLKAEASTWTQSTTADPQGDAVFTAVPS